MQTVRDGYLEKLHQLGIEVCESSSLRARHPQVCRQTSRQLFLCKQRLMDLLYGAAQAVAEPSQPASSNSNPGAAQQDWTDRVAQVMETIPEDCEAEIHRLVDSCISTTRDALQTMRA